MDTVAASAASAAHAARTNAAWLWTNVLKPDAPGIIAIIIAVLTVVLLLCIGRNLVRSEQDMQEGVVGGRGIGAQYPGPGGLYPGDAKVAMTLYSDPAAAGQPLTPSCNARSLGTPPIIENVPYDARWLISRAGWAYGPMSGEGREGREDRERVNTGALTIA